MTENKTDNSEKRERIAIWLITTFFELAFLYAWSLGKLNKNKDGQWFISLLVITTACSSFPFSLLTEELHRKWKTWKIIIVNTILAAMPCLLFYGLAYSAKDTRGIPIVAWLFMGLGYLCTPLVAVVPMNTIISRIHYLYCRKNERE